MDEHTREVVRDLCGAMLSQSDLEQIINEANAPGDERFVTITIKKIARHQVPRLIVDYGDLVHRLALEMERRETESTPPAQQSTRSNGSAEFSAELARSFQIVDDWSGYKDQGVMSLRVSADFIYDCKSHAELVRRLKAALPPDAKIIAPDGQPIRLAASTPGYGMDHWAMIFASNEWPKVSEGSTIPELRPFFISEKITNERAEQIEIIGPPPANVGMELRIDRSTHFVQIPRERETKQECVVEVRPKR